jgi:glucose/mannose transport system substrate-binding protein
MNRIRRALITASACLVLPAAFFGCGNGIQGKLEIDTGIFGQEGIHFIALTAPFEKKFPGVTVVISDDHDIGFRRIKGGLPPDTYVTYPGKFLTENETFNGRFEDLTDLAHEQGWDTQLPSRVRQYFANGKGWFVAPLGVHRTALLCYQAEDLKGLGLPVPRTWDEFIAAANTLRAHRFTVMRLGLFDMVVLFEAVAIAELGPDRWEALWEGRLAPDAPEVISAWRKYKAVLDACGQYSLITFDSPNSENQPPDGVFIVTTDKDPRLFDKDVNPAAGWDWAPAPGTDGLFVFFADGFVLPRSAKNEAAAREWLKFAASPEGEDAYNRARGAVSARLDTNRAGLSGYWQKAAQDYREKRLIGSLAYGMISGPVFFRELMFDIERYVLDPTPDAAAKAFAALMKKHGISK